MLDSRESDLEFAKAVLARLERYAAQGSQPGRSSHRRRLHPRRSTRWPRRPRRDQTCRRSFPGSTSRSRTRAASTTNSRRRPAPAAHHRRTTTRRRIDPATVDLFPYDLAAAIVTCALTVFAFAALGTVAGVIVTVALVAAGIGARQYRYFPSAGVKALIGVAVGLLLVLLS